MRDRRDHLTEFGQPRDVDQFRLQLEQLPVADIAFHFEGPRHPGIDRAGLDQQHKQHQGRGHQAVQTAGIEAKVEAAGIEHRAQADLEQPGRHDHHEPHVEHRICAPLPQDEQRHEAQRPDRAGDDRQHRRICVAAHDGREQFVAHGGEQGRAANRGQDDGTRNGDGEPWTSHAPAVAQICVGDHGEREAGVPDHVQPGGGLRTGTDQAGRPEQAREAERVGHRHQGREQIAARKDEKRRRAEDGELREQQDRGDKVVDQKRRLVARDEGPDLRELHPGKRRGQQEQAEQDQHDKFREPTLPHRCRQGGKEHRPFRRRLMRHSRPPSLFTPLRSIQPKSTVRQVR